MALYRTISLSFWTDTKIADEFTPEDRYFYLYLFTNPHTNLAGCYEISIKQIAYEIGYNADTVEHLLTRFSNVHGVAKYSRDTKEMLLINWHKYNWTSSEKYRKPLKKEIDGVKNSSFKEYLLSVFNGEKSEGYPIDTICIDTSNTLSNTNTNADTNTVKKAKRFVPPTVDEVRAYCKERNNKINAESFVNFYESKGWKVGKESMKDWKAAIRTWEQRDNETPKKKTDSMTREYSDADYLAFERKKLGIGGS